MSSLSRACDPGLVSSGQWWDNGRSVLVSALFAPIFLPIPPFSPLSSPTLQRDHYDCQTMNCGGRVAVQSNSLKRNSANCTFYCIFFAYIHLRQNQFKLNELQKIAVQSNALLLVWIPLLQCTATFAYLYDRPPAGNVSLSLSLLGNRKTMMIDGMHGANVGKLIMLILIMMLVLRSKMMVLKMTKPEPNVVLG